MCMCHSTHVKVTGQLVGVGSLSLSTMCVQGFELRLSGLVADALMH